MRFFIHGCQLALLCATACGGRAATAVELSGLLDLRLVASDATRSWTREGLDKTRFDRNTGPARLGHGILRADGEIGDRLTGTMVLATSDDRVGVFDVTEAWLGWNPVPTNPWKTRVRVGAFFPATSLEVDYDSVGWTPTRTLSSSAINSWFGEELRTNGIELTLTRKGLPLGSSHDFGFTAALFGYNDPIGSLLAWRGWSISDRITGLSEPLRLADLPIYRATGALPNQDRSLHLFREIDNRAGYYLGANYAYGSKLELAALHYDNRADPLQIKSGQYSWNTRFDHLSARFQFGRQWEVLLQALSGETIMGPNAVRLNFQAWYALLSLPLGPGQLGLRFDQFGATEHATDLFPSDPNGENGRALAVAYRWPLDRTVSLVSEALVVQSNRPARSLLGDPADKTERSLSVAIRWQF